MSEHTEDALAVAMAFFAKSWRRPEMTAKWRPEIRRVFGESKRGWPTPPLSNYATWLVAGARNHLQANRSLAFRFEIGT
jgi:hypothetical protein